MGIDRQKQIVVRVNDEELKLIKKKADKLGLSISAFLRMIAKKTTIKELVI